MKKKWSWNNTITWKDLFVLSALSSVMGVAITVVLYCLGPFLYKKHIERKEVEEESAE